MKNNYIQILSSIAFFSVFLCFSSCKKDSTTSGIVVPSISTTNAIINVTTTTAQSGGTITNDGGAVITANGVVYSSSDVLPALDDSKTSDPVSNSGIASSAFTSSLTGLTPNTTYYVRAYATNSAGTGYGAVIKFTTSSNLLAVNATVTTFAGNGTAGYTDGSGTGALFNNPEGLTVDSKGNIFVSDTYNNNIREITPQGATSTIAGDGNIGFLNGPTASSSEFYAPVGLTFDGSGSLFIADYGNNVIRKMTSAGVVSTYVGTGQSGYNDGTDPLFYYYNNPAGVVLDAAGNLYIADKGNSLIRKVTAAGISSVFAGSETPGFANGTGAGTSTAAAAAFKKPNAIAIDAAGNLYVADQGNYAIRKITPAGVVTTLAGGPTQPNVIGIPTGIALDATGNIYITDETGRILEYTTANVLYVLAGTANVSGFTNGSGTNATFDLPYGITIDANNNIYVADKNNNCIRKITISSVTQ